MKIFGLNILTNKQLDDLEDEYIKQAFNIWYEHLKTEKIIPELERLKNDHWDKNAFDRLINRLKIVEFFASKK